MNKKIETVVPLSGGLDSVVLLYKLLKEGKNIRAVHFNLGRPTSKSELGSAKHIALRTNTPLDIVDLTGLQEMQIGYLPKDVIDARDLDIKAYPEITPRDVGQRFSTDQVARSDGLIVSAFHTIMSAAGLNAQLTGADSIHVAVLKEQTEINSSLLDALSYIEKGTSLLSPAAPSFHIHTPFSDMTKAEVVKLGDSLNVPFASSHSCLAHSSMHCGVCSQCIARKKAFKIAGVVDPTQYAK